MNIVGPRSDAPESAASQEDQSFAVKHHHIAGLLKVEGVVRTELACSFVQQWVDDGALTRRLI